MQRHFTFTTKKTTRGLLSTRVARVQGGTRSTAGIECSHSLVAMMAAQGGTVAGTKLDGLLPGCPEEDSTGRMKLFSPLINKDLLDIYHFAHALG